ncbi:hypothetical protein, conserved [Cyanidioschyzon merolae strain 10D]|jgi:hypothetical protein|uniref:General transcription and DNA repair factor IIH subunit TFB5 n=1 Tax=Cyanidioschyzon merolae (strain NIES-3377 / 10D) TaxID=280699 RepID=M1VAQ5_CYAM1|nr:hypothetical protein, conserved [Cyanidioschyzon merolae strain 10D]BAM82229.1 hypothetical protein, conserved [Cyanidioschyzon merolae strain 10D]|eukprot:XP_005538265.1 hypothetical protein, conserved [Cyanidioschyzon merolae strain 10D]
MVHATKGYLVRCDVPMKQLLLHLDREEHFIICDLDEKHLFVKEDALSLIQQSVEALYDEVYYGPQEPGPRRQRAGASTGTGTQESLD